MRMRAIALSPLNENGYNVASSLSTCHYFCVLLVSINAIIHIPICSFFKMILKASSTFSTGYLKKKKKKKVQTM